MPRQAASTETLSDIAAEIFPTAEEQNSERVHKNEPIQDPEEQNLELVHENEPEIKEDEEIKDEEQQSVGDGEGTGETPEFATLNELLSEVVEQEDLPSVYNLPIKLDSGETVVLGEVKDQLQARDRKIHEQEQQLQAVSAASNQSLNVAPPPEAIEAMATIRSLADQWNQLEANKDKIDPGKLALARQDLETRYQTAIYERDQAVRKHRGEVLAKRKEFVDGQVEKLVEGRPELKTPKNMKAAIDTIRNISAAYGLTANEVMQIVDHRHINMLLDLAAYRAKEQEGKKLLETGKRGSVVRLKAGARKGKPNVKKKTQNLEQKAKANPKDKSALFKALNAIADEGGIKVR